MTKQSIVLTKIEASEGMYLTNGSEFGRTVYVGKNDKEENWHEITEAEYKRLISEKEDAENEVHP